MLAILRQMSGNRLNSGIAMKYSKRHCVRKAITSPCITDCKMVLSTQIGRFFSTLGPKEKKSGTI